MTSHEDLTPREMLASADPQSTLPPLRSDETITLARRAADAAERPQPSRRARRAGVWAGAAAIVVGGIAAVIAVPLALAPASAPMMLEQVPGGVSAKCIAPDAAMLESTADAMFRAEVTEISGGIVTLHVVQTLAGDVGSVVEVPQGDGMISDGGPLVFDAGSTYLLATQDGMILSCGLSGPASSELEALYLEAANAG